MQLTIPAIYHFLSHILNVTSFEICCDSLMSSSHNKNVSTWLQNNTEIILLLVNAFWFINLSFMSMFVGLHFFQLSEGDYILTGFLMGIPYLTMTISSFIFGKLADVRGERIILIVAFSAVIISDFVYYLITDSITFFIVYILFNLPFAAYQPALNRFCSRIVKDRDIFGRLTAFTSIGSLIGTISAGFIFDRYGMYPIFILGLISGLIGFFGVLFMRTSKVDKILEGETVEAGKSVDLKPSNIKNERLGILNQIKRIMNLHIVILIIVSTLVYFSGREACLLRSNKFLFIFNCFAPASPENTLTIDFLIVFPSSQS